MNKENTIKYTIAIPFLTNEYTFSISRKTNWSIIDYLFLKELSQSDPCRQIRTVKLGRFNYAA